MDDLVCGDNNLENALRLQKEIVEILKQGQFYLHKWASNEPLLIHTHKVPNQREELTVNFTDKTDTKTLGLGWNCQDDSLKYQFQNAHSNNGFTKRTVLSNIAKIFDPLGFITPFVIQAKVVDL
jgi:hypothetical protein